MDRSSAIQQIKLENEGSFEGEFDEESLFGNSNCLTTESITAHCYRKVKTSILNVSTWPNNSYGFLDYFERK